MDDQELVRQLLKLQESDELDFKSGQYRLDNNHLKSEFIKDIVAMANTLRERPAYILLGVKDNLTMDPEIKGVSCHHDEANLLGIISSRVEPTPRFTYRLSALQWLGVGDLRDSA